MKKTLLEVSTAALLSLSVSNGQAASTQNNTELLSALSTAYQNNPTIHAALREYYAAVEAIPSARAGWLPSIALTGSAQHQKAFSKKGPKSTPPTTEDKTAVDSLSMQASLSQNLYNGGKTSGSIDQATSSVKAAEMSFVAAEQKLLLEALSAYITLWSAYETLDYRKSSVSFRERFLAQVNAQEQVGEATRTDVAEARSSLAGAVADRLTAEAAVAAAQAKYSQVIGGYGVPETVKIPGLLVSKAKLPVSINTLNDLVISQSPSVKRAVYAEKAQKAGVGVAEADLLPSIDFSATGSRGKSNTQSKDYLSPPPNESSGYGYETSGTVGLKLTIPLFQQGGKWSGVRRANQQRYQARSSLEAARLEAIQSATTTWQNLKALEAALKQTELQVSAAKLSLEGKRQEYLVGEKSLTDTLNAEERLVTTQVQLVSRQKEYQLAFYQLMSQYGALLPKELGLDIDRYDIASYTDDMSGKLFGTGDLRAPKSTEN